MARIIPPVPGPGTVQSDYAWLDWYEKVSRAIENAQVSDPTLEALAALSPNPGLLEQTTPDAFTVRPIGTSNGSDIPTYADAQALITAHEAALDPHPQYTTASEVASDIAAHVAAVDPHGDRAYAVTQDALHVAASDPHPQYETATEVNSKIATHSAAVDPHGDRAYAAAQDALHVAAADPHSQYETAAEVNAKIATHSAATDPHGDRAFATAADSTLIATHLAAADPHTQYALVAGDTFTGAVLFPDGTAAAPSISFSTDIDCGFYRASSNVIGFSVNGAEVGRFTANGIYLGTTAGVTGIGNLALNIAGIGYGSGSATISRFDNTTGGGALYLAKSRGTTVSDYTAVQSGDILGVLGFMGSDGTTMSNNSSISGRAAEAWTAVAKGTYLSFATTATGTTTSTERLRISDDGAMGFGGANYGTSGQYLKSNGSFAVPTWVDPLGGAEPWTYLKRATNFTTTSTSYVNVTTLTFTPVANETYEVEGFFIIDGSIAAAEPSVSVTWPTGMTAGAYQLQTINGTSATGPYTIIGGSTDNVTPVDSTSDHSAKLHATIVTGAAPSGAVQVQLKSSSANTVTMKAGSWIRYRQI